MEPVRLLRAGGAGPASPVTAVRPEDALLNEIRAEAEALLPGSSTAELRAKCTRLLALNPAFAVRRNVVSGFLWKLCMYQPISICRRSLRKVGRSCAIGGALGQEDQ